MTQRFALYLSTAKIAYPGDLLFTRRQSLPAPNAVAGQARSSIDHGGATSDRQSRDQYPTTEQRDQGRSPALTAF